MFNNIFKMHIFIDDIIYVTGGGAGMQGKWVKTDVASFDLLPDLNN